MSFHNSLFKSTEGAQIVNVNPSMAKILIDKANFDNRKIQQGVVMKYASMMKSGEWLFSPETISISTTGKLLNGQHRMLAVIESGISCKFLFATGFQDNVFAVLDRGAGRSRADALKVSRRLAESGALLVRLANEYHRRPITDFDVSRAIYCIQDIHNDLLEFCNSHAKVFSSAPFRLAAVARVAAGAPRDYVFDLYRNLTLAHTDSLPPIGHAVMRAVVTGRLRSGGGDAQIVNACVGWDIFNKNSSYKSKITASFRPESASELTKGLKYE